MRRGGGCEETEIIIIGYTILEQPPKNFALAVFTSLHSDLSQYDSVILLVQLFNQKLDKPFRPVYSRVPPREVRLAGRN